MLNGGIYEELARRLVVQPFERETGISVDVVPGSAAEIVTRTSNEYRQHADRGDQFCLICLNYVPPPSPDRCGTCKTVKGPINPDGWCKQWTARRA